MKKIILFSIIVAGMLFGACQKEVLSSAKEIKTIEEKSADLKFGFTTKKKTLIAREHTKKANLEPRYGHTSVVFDDKMWILGGMRDAMPSNDILFSSDGENWHTVKGKTKFTPRTDHASVVFDGKIWVVGGKFYDPDNHNEVLTSYDDEYTELGDVWSSSDVVEWELVSHKNTFPARANHSLAAFEGSLWITGGRSELLHTFCCDYGSVYRSANGIEWTKVFDGTPGDWRILNHSSIGFNHRLWVFGANSQTHHTGSFSSANGEYWQAHSEIDKDTVSVRKNIGLASDGNLLWVTAGIIPYNGYPSDIWYSNDGEHWSEAIPDKQFPGRSGHTALYFKNKLWIINGLSYPIKDIGGITGKGTAEHVPLSDIWSFEDPDCCEIDDITLKVEQ